MFFIYVIKVKKKNLEINYEIIIYALYPFAIIKHDASWNPPSAVVSIETFERFVLIKNIFISPTRVQMIKCPSKIISLKQYYRTLSIKVVQIKISKRRDRGETEWISSSDDEINTG